MTITLALGCAGQPTRTAQDGPSRVRARPFAVRFENEERQYVHVYLVSDRREWMLGRVEPGAVRTLQIPDEALGSSAFVRLAVLAGDQMKLQTARISGATLTIAQPASVILSQRWKFSQGQITALGR
jgi:hypothetical protein